MLFWTANSLAENGVFISNAKLLITAKDKRIANRMFFIMFIKAILIIVQVLKPYIDQIRFETYLDNIGIN